MDPKNVQAYLSATRPPQPPRAPGGPATARPLGQQKPSGQQKPPGQGLTFRDFRLVSAAGKDSKKTVHNLMIFSGTKPVNPKDFVRPVKLQRKDPNAQPPSTSDNMEDVKIEEPQRGPKSGADTSLIAPMGGATRNKQLLFRKRTKQIFLANEETLKTREAEQKPWVLEDDDDQNWVGTLEGGQQSNYVFFVFADNGFKVVPANKWYRFKQKIPYQTLTIDQAEEQLKKRSKLDAGDRWLMKKDQKKAVALGLDKLDPQEGGLYQPPAPSVVVGRGHGSGKRDSEEFDEFDFEAVLSDDEEGHEDLEAEDEETKIDRNRVKRDAVKDLVSDEDDEIDQKAASSSKLTQEGKVVKKHLKKVDKTVYGDDEEEDPYASGEEMLDSDAEEVETEKEIKLEPDIATNASQQMLKRPAVQINAIKKKKESSTSIPKASGSDPRKFASVDKKAFDKKKLAASMARDSLSKGRSPAVSPPLPIKQERASSPPVSSLPRANSPTAKIEGSSSQAPSLSAAGYSAGSSDFKKRKRIKRDDQTSGGETSGGEASSSETMRKRKTRETAPDQVRSPASATSPPSETAGDGSLEDANLITEAEVVAALTGKRLTPLELLKCFKEKLKKDERNKKVVSQLAKKVAKVKDGLLELKD